MAKFDSVINNFDNHLRSGLCGLIPAAYESFENGGGSRIKIELLDDLAIGAIVGNFQIEAKKAKEKLGAILASETNTQLDDIDSVRIEIDFLPNDVVTLERRATLANARVWYGYSPVYNFETYIRLKNGAERILINRDPGREN